MNASQANGPLRSTRWFGSETVVGMLHRASVKAEGFTQGALDVQTIVALVGEPERWSEGDLLVLVACYGFGYAISLAAFRGGPVFPAVMLGVALGELIEGLPDLGHTPAIAICMAALTVSMLRFPVASILLVAILLASSALAVMPLIILSAVAAFVVTELIDPPPRASSGA